MTSNMIEKVRAMYLNQYKKYGIHQNSLFWPKGRQALRFKQHLSILEEPKKYGDRAISILDYGCGFSDLYDYINRLELEIAEYIGVDILEEFLEVSKKKFSHNNYYTRDNFCTNQQISADLILASGTFNIKYFKEYEKNYNFVLSEIDMLFKRTKICLSFDFMTDEVDFMNIEAFHISPSRLEEDLNKNNKYGEVRIIKSEIPYEYLGQIWT